MSAALKLKQGYGEVVEMPERRGGWYKNPQFVWSIVTFVFVQACVFIAADRRATSQASAQTQDFAGFQKTVLDRLNNLDKQQDKMLTVWQAEHDDVRTLKGNFDALRSDLNRLVTSYDADKRTSDELIRNTRERLLKEEARH